MSLPPSDFPLPAPISSRPASQRRRSLAKPSIGFTIAAAVLDLAWGPVMVVIAFAMRPPQLNGGRYGYQQVAPFQRAAEIRMWIVLIASFLLILALATVAIILGRRALRFAGSGATIAQLQKWGGICLTISLLSLICVVLIQYAPTILRLPIFFSYLYTISQFIVVVLATATAIGAMGSFILNGIAVRKASVRAWLSLVVSTLVMLLWFLAVAFLAQFIVAFYLHLVY